MSEDVREGRWIDNDPEPDAHVELLDRMIERLLAEEDARPQWWRLTDKAMLAELERLQCELATLQARRLSLLAEAEKREATLKLTGLPTASWLTDHNTHFAKTARDEVRLAVTLEQQPLVRDAFSRGGLSIEQVKVISTGINRLPEELDSDQRERVEDHLVRLGAEFGPSGLARLVNRAVEVVAPQVAEDADRKAVERMEAEQQRGRYLTWHHDPDDGSVVLRGKLPAVAGQKLIGLVRVLATSQRKSAALVGVEVSRPQANADALVVLAEHVTGCTASRREGAERARLLVRIDLDTLLAGLGTATLVDNGQPISAREARLLACDAGILPVVMGNTSSVPLDVGRKKRLFTGTLRNLILARDQGCAFPGCDRAPAECDLHHPHPWNQGGRTSYTNGVTVCSYHHHLVEPDPNAPPGSQWAIRYDTRGNPEFGAPEGLGAPPGQRRWRQHHRYTTLR
jgi:hypothetical protein